MQHPIDITTLVNYMSSYIQLTADEVSIIAKHVTRRSYLKGQYVVQQGDVCKYESFVVKGCLRSFYVDHQGDEHIIMFAVENWWTADLGSFITQTPATYNVHCLEPTEVIQFAHDDLETLYLLVPKLERFFRIIFQKAYVAAERRIIRNFSMAAKNRYLEFQRQYPDIEQRVPLYMIASYLGITKEFLSKVRSQLANEDFNLG